MELPKASASQEKIILLRRFVILLFVGLLSGFMLSTLIIWLPYNRIVVFDQPVGANIRIRSIRLAQGGYVLIFLDTGTGAEIVGNTSYLPAGYYHNITTQLDLSEILAHVSSSHLFIRIYTYPIAWGDFSDSLGTPVRDIFGGIYTKNFWFTYTGAEKQQFFLHFMGSPLSMLTDFLFP